MKRIAIPLLLAASACVPEQGPLMAPFQDCIGCHNGNDATRWTVAGTWAKGAHITITDSAGKTVTLRGNQVGNFYTAEGLAFPITVSVDGKVMPDPTALVEPKPSAKVTYGGCNLCHRASEVTMTFDEFMLPGADCLTCHAPGGMAATKPASTFYAAGTFPPPEWPQGTSVSVAGQSATTNRVGNFYITTPIDFRTPRPASVAGKDMENGAPYGGCNACHANGHANDD